MAAIDHLDPFAEWPMPFSEDRLGECNYILNWHDRDMSNAHHDTILREPSEALENCLQAGPSLATRSDTPFAAIWTDTPVSERRKGSGSTIRGDKFSGIRGQSRRTSHSDRDTRIPRTVSRGRTSTIDRTTQAVIPADTRARPTSNNAAVDFDSDSSWVELDGEADWHSQLRQQLRRFREANETVAFLTSPLGSSKRKQVHALASLLGLGHMSIEAGSKKKILLSKCAIVKATNAGVIRNSRWNSSRRDIWRQGFIEPTIILVRWSTERKTGFRDFLHRNGMPQPRQATVEIREQASISYAAFDEPTNAATVICALDALESRHMSGQYLHFPEGFNLTTTLMTTDFQSLTTLLATAEASVNSSNIYAAHTLRRKGAFCSDVQPHTGEVTRAAENLRSQDSEASLLQLPSLNHSSRSLSTRQSTPSKDIGYTSAASDNLDSDYSAHTSTSKKRRRAPRIIAGYPCSQCDRVYDHAGELRKHEKQFHLGERPHACNLCESRFLFPKDLRRHQKTVHAHHTISSTSPHIIHGDFGMNFIANTFDAYHLNSQEYRLSPNFHTSQMSAHQQLASPSHYAPTTIRPDASLEPAKRLTRSP